MPDIPTEVDNSILAAYEKWLDAREKVIARIIDMAAKGITYDTIGREVGMSRQRVGQILWSRGIYIQPSKRIPHAPVPDDGPQS
jgi:hypothetical protein